MNLNSRIILTARKFFKKYGKIIVIVFSIWLVIFLFNRYLKNKPEELKIKTNYRPNEPIMDEGKQIPKKQISKVNQTIDEYFNFCNLKEYEDAFNMLTYECKNALFDNNIEKFKSYIDKIYTKKKIYNIQNYSNADNIYIYDICILDDITATGTTEDYDKYQEKITVHKIDDEMKLSVKGYIGKTTLEKETQDDNIKVKVLYKDISYEKEEYTLEIRNKTDNYILISDEMGGSQITLNLEDQYRNALNTVNNSIIILPERTDTVKLSFTKYFDDGVVPSEINFNNIRILSKLSSDEVKDEDILKKYRLNIQIK